MTTISLRTLTDEIRDHERVLAPCSESYLWGEYLTRMHALGMDAIAAHRDHDEAPQVDVREAAWWLGAYALALAIQQDTTGAVTMDAQPTHEDYTSVAQTLGVDDYRSIEGMVSEGWDWYLALAVS